MNASLESLLPNLGGSNKVGKVFEKEWSGARSMVKQLNKIGDDASATLKYELEQITNPYYSSSGAEILNRLRRNIKDSVKPGEMLSKTSLEHLAKLDKMSAQGTKFSAAQLQQILHELRDSPLNPARDADGNFTAAQLDILNLRRELLAGLKKAAPKVPVDKLNKVIQMTKTSANDVVKNVYWV